MNHVPNLVGDRGRLDEEWVIRRLGSHRPGPFQVDNRVDHNVGDMNAFRSQFYDGFGEYPLRRLGWGKSAKRRFSTQG